MKNLIVILLILSCCTGACWKPNNGIVQSQPIVQYVVQGYYVTVQPVVHQIVWVPVAETRVEYKPMMVSVPSNYYSSNVVYCDPYWGQAHNNWVRYNY